MIIEFAEKLKGLKQLIASIEKQFGKGSIMSLGDDTTSELQTLPTGSLGLDLALGIGGYPKGRVVEIYGPESSGKTTLTLHAIHQAQKLGGVAAFIDAEHAFDPSYARSIGVDTDKLLVSQPDSGEQALEIVEMLTRSGNIDLIVVDSVAALTPLAEIDSEMRDAHIGLQARLMSKALRKLTSMLHKTDTLLIFINQLRQKIGMVSYGGSSETTTGGNALKFYASVRLDVRRIGTVKVSDEALGSRTRVKVVKNKCAPPFKETEFDIRWGTGIDNAMDVIDIALAKGIIEKNGSHLSFAGSHLAQGREKAREAILNNVQLMKTIKDSIEASASKETAKIKLAA